MRLLVLIPVIVSMGIVAGSGVGQPRDGDLVFAGRSCVQGQSVLHQGIIAFASPKAPGAWSTLAYYSKAQVNSIRMAGNNQDLVFSVWDSGGTHGLRRLDPVTKSTGLVAKLPDFTCDLALDYDDAWIVCGMDPPTFAQSRLWRVSSSGAFSTIANLPAYVGYLAIDREPTAVADYLLASYNPGSRASFFFVSRSQGITASFSHKMAQISEVEVDQLTGDYLALASSGGPYRISKNGLTATTVGKWATSPSGYTTFVMRRDGTFWMIDGGGVGTWKDRMVRHVSSAGTAISSHAIQNIGALWGMEIYGSRRLTCVGTGKPGGRVVIRLVSTKAGDAGKPYVLACSFGRRPKSPQSCWKLGGRDFLFLDPYDALFKLSALNLAPAVFKGFSGVTDQGGAATAYVDIPKNLPSGTGISVFVAGAIYDGSRILTVTNTHWFVLN